MDTDKLTAEWIERVRECHNGKTKKLMDEMDAIRGFLNTISKDYKEEEPGISVICALIHDICIIVQLDLLARYDTLIVKKEKTLKKKGR